MKTVIDKITKSDKYNQGYAWAEHAINEGHTIKEVETCVRNPYFDEFDYGAQQYLLNLTNSNINLGE
jgi:hypothetical protein